MEVARGVLCRVRKPMIDLCSVQRCVLLLFVFIKLSSWVSKTCVSKMHVVGQADLREVVDVEVSW